MMLNTIIMANGHIAECRPTLSPLFKHLSVTPRTSLPPRTTHQQHCWWVDPWERREIEERPCVAIAAENITQPSTTTYPRPPSGGTSGNSASTTETPPFSSTEGTTDPAAESSPACLDPCGSSASRCVSWGVGLSIAVTSNERRAADAARKEELSRDGQRGADS
ncbi:hypothetical protein BD309DRAFT_972632 [Dichomitus squalens]|nr:hypothetical protein BD309DRAFT_972632 [Dichomitus squalens]